MFNKINIFRIFKDHFSTLRSHRTKKIYLPDVFLFLISPLAISVVLVLGKIFINKDLANILITSFSIFSGLLLNLLLLVFDVSNKQEKKEVLDALKELYINISFCILTSIFVIVFVLIFSFFNYQNIIYSSVISLFIYYPLFVSLLTLFMIVKRIYVIFSLSFN